MIDGRFRRPIAITVPGMFLSQPGSATSPSYHWAPMTVSIESAIRSRDCSEKLIPSVPIEMPSDTPTVLNRIPTIPAATTPSFTRFPRSARCMLQGLPSYQTEQMPTWGFLRSSNVSPVARSIACDAPWIAGCVSLPEYLLRTDLVGVKVGINVLVASCRQITLKKGHHTLGELSPTEKRRSIAFQRVRRAAGCAVDRLEKLSGRRARHVEVQNRCGHRYCLILRGARRSGRRS